jgi:hypothetical protein
MCHFCGELFDAEPFYQVSKGNGGSYYYHIDILVEQWNRFA